MGSRCYDCGEKFGRCYEHAGNCPDDCHFGKHNCPAEGIDYGLATEADVAMLKHAMVGGVEDTDFREFYIEDDE